MEISYFFAGAGVVAGFAFGWWLFSSILSHNDSISELECDMEEFKENMRWKERGYSDDISNIHRSVGEQFHYLEQRVSKLEEAQKPKKQVIYDVKD